MFGTGFRTVGLLHESEPERPDLHVLQLRSSRANPRGDRRRVRRRDPEWSGVRSLFVVGSGLPVGDFRPSRDLALRRLRSRVESDRATVFPNTRRGAADRQLRGNVEGAQSLQLRTPRGVTE